MHALAPFHSQYEIEAHQEAATVYMRGSLSVAGAMAVMRSAETLPDYVRALVVDLRAVSQVEAAGIYALHDLLRRWKAGRNGAIRVLPPLRRAA
jgi:ABC-type transporter Mla MlaB component